MDNLPATQAPSSLIAIALDKGADASALEKLEKVLELQERYEANEARKAYHNAMAKFKANPPDIEKDRHVKYTTQKGTTEYNHASLANVTEKINKALSEHGLSASWATQQTNGSVSVECKITHELGHSESTILTAEPDTSGNKNPIQAIGSTVAYLERYTLLALTGLATKDMDDDGQSATVEYISDKQLSDLMDIIDDRKVDEKKFCEFMGVETVGKIPAKDFNKAMAAAKSKKKTE